MKIYLARHGESIGNSQKLIFGVSDYPLTEKGIMQAEELRDKLKSIDFSDCYTSELSRAYITAEICLKNRNKNITKLAGLNEQNLGALEGKNLDQLVQNNLERIGDIFENLVHNPPAGSESYKDMYDRVSECLKKIIDKNEDVLIVSHTGPLSIIVTNLLHLPIKIVHSFFFEFGTYSMLEIQDNKTKLRCFNK